MRKKRILSDIIDYGLIVIILAVLCKSVPLWFWSIDFKIGVVPVQLPSFGILVVVLPIFFKDMLFKNASLGKKIMGLIIVDDKWQAPNFKTMLKRGILITTWGFAISFKYKYGGEDFILWELNHLHTRVVEKKQYKEMSEQCKDNADNFASQMDALFKSTTES